MQCPGCRCDDPMERQDGYTTNSKGEIINKEAQYACLECGREYLWQLGIPGLLPLFNAEDFEPPQPAWRDPA